MTSNPSSVTSSLRRIFAGQHGIRVVWGVPLFVAIYLILDNVAAAALRHLVPSQSTGRLPPKLVFLEESLDVLVVFLATWAMARIENRPLFSFGYAGDHKFARLVSGAAWGLWGLSTLIGVLWMAHLVVFDGLSLTGVSAWKYALEWALVALLVGIFEESLLRGYLQSTLARGLGFWWAALLLSAAFALWHLSNGGESPLGLLVVGMGGLVFCLSLWYTKSLWWAVASTLDGTGANRTFMEHRTAACWPRVTCSRRILQAIPCGAEARQARREA
jgi:membrane protease YdiL (CAAX protease family)